MNESELIFDKLAEFLFPELDEAMDREAQYLMGEHNINMELMNDLLDAWLLKRARQVEE